MGAPRLTSGPGFLQKAFNDLAAYAEANVPIGPGVTDSSTGKGRYIAASSTSGPTAAAAPITYPWQPYPSPWTGTGTDPYASDRAKRFRLRRGKFSSRTPSNMSDEQVAFGDITDTGITEDDAVYTQVYLSVPVTETTLGQGDAAYGIPTIMIIEGDDLITALGTTLPNTGEDGTLPANLIVPLCEVSIWGAAMHFEPGVQSYLDAVLEVTSGCQFNTRQITPVGIIRPAA